MQQQAHGTQMAQAQQARHASGQSGSSFGRYRSTEPVHAGDRRFVKRKRAIKSQGQDSGRVAYLVLFVLVQSTWSACIRKIRDV